MDKTTKVSRGGRVVGTLNVLVTVLALGATVVALIIGTIT